MLRRWIEQRAGEPPLIDLSTERPVIQAPVRRRCRRPDANGDAAPSRATPGIGLRVAFGDYGKWPLPSSSCSIAVERDTSSLTCSRRVRTTSSDAPTRCGSSCTGSPTRSSRAVCCAQRPALPPVRASRVSTPSGCGSLPRSRAATGGVRPQNPAPVAPARRRPPLRRRRRSPPGHGDDRVHVPLRSTVGSRVGPSWRSPFSSGNPARRGIAPSRPPRAGPSGRRECHHCKSRSRTDRLATVATRGTTPRRRSGRDTARSAVPRR